MLKNIVIHLLLMINNNRDLGAKKVRSKFQIPNSISQTPIITNNLKTL
jgi:hypothetical protein